MNYIKLLSKICNYKKILYSGKGDTMMRFKTKPEISIIIPTYNRRELLKKTIESIKNQKIDKSIFEIIVVDDGSNDNTYELISEYLDKINIKYFYQPDKGYRVAKARNTGIKKSAGKICLFIDSGVILSDDCVNEHLHIYRQNNNLAVIGYVCGFYSAEDKRRELRNKIENLSDDKILEEIKQKDNKYFIDIRENHYKKFNYNMMSMPAPWIFFWTCHVSVSKNSLLQVGLFDEYFRTWGAEDIELGFRLFEHNVDFILNRNAYSFHYPHEHSLYNKKASYYKNLAYILKKHKHSDVINLLKNNDIMDLNYILLKAKL